MNKIDHTGKKNQEDNNNLMYDVHIEWKPIKVGLGMKL